MGRTPFQARRRTAPGYGLHPIAVFDTADSSVSFSTPPGTALNPTDPSSVQLVACTERTGEGEQVTTCQYNEVSAAMLSGHAQDHRV